MSLEENTKEFGCKEQFHLFTLTLSVYSKRLVIPSTELKCDVTKENKSVLYYNEGLLKQEFKALWLMCKHNRSEI